MTGADRRLINKDGPRLPEYLETSGETAPGLPAERSHEIRSDATRIKRDVTTHDPSPNWGSRFIDTLTSKYRYVYIYCLKIRECIVSTIATQSCYGKMYNLD